MNELIQFNFDNKQIRTVLINGIIHFVATDIASALGYSKPNNAISKHCRSTLKWGIPHPQSETKIIEVNVIPESDVYRLIIKSELPEAERFEDWIVEDVIPSIRTTGVYSVNDEYEIPDNLGDALILAGEKQKLLEQREVELAQVNSHCKQLENKIEKDAPKVAFAKRISISKDLIEIGEFAKTLKVKGVGRNKMFKFLRDHGFLNYKNEPYQKYVNQGLFDYKEKQSKRDGRLYFQTYLTGKGQVKIAEKLCPEASIVISNMLQPKFNFESDV